MNCAELAALLEQTLLYERDPQLVREARCHAEQCPSCARLWKLHEVEEQLTELPAVLPSSVFLETVMNRITQVEPVAAPSFQGFWYSVFKYPMIFVGALILVFAYVVPAAGESWLSSLWPSIGYVRIALLSTYLTQHPPWAVLLAGAAALLIVLGLGLPDRPDMRTYDIRS